MALSDILSRPRGQKRPADVIRKIVRAMQIVMSEAEEKFDEDGKNKATVVLGWKGGKYDGRTENRGCAAYRPKKMES